MTTQEILDAFIQAEKDWSEPIEYYNRKLKEMQDACNEANEIYHNLLKQSKWNLIKNLLNALQRVR